MPESTKVGKYESRYWTKLTDLLDENQHSSNWLHIYVKDSLLPSPKKARDLIQDFNYKKNGNQVHVTLASFLTISLIFRTLKDWYKVLKFNIKFTFQCMKDFTVVRTITTPQWFIGVLTKECLHERFLQVRFTGLSRLPLFLKKVRPYP